MKILALLFLFCTFSIYSQTSIFIKANKEAKEKTEAADKKPNAINFSGNEEVRLFFTPRETIVYFLESMDKFKRGDSKGLDNAISTLDLSDYASNTRKFIGRIVAERLINTMDRIHKVDIDSVPNYTESPAWYFRKQSITVKNKIVDVEIGIAKDSTGNFLFTKETVKSIEDFYFSVRNMPVVNGVITYKSSFLNTYKGMLPLWTQNKIFLFDNWQWIALFVLIIISFLGMYLVRLLALIYARRFLEEQRLYRSTKAFGVLAFLIIFHFGIKFLDLDLEILEIILRGSYIAITLSSVWTLLKVVDFFTTLFEEKAKKTENKFDDVLVPLLSKTAKVVVVSFGALFVAHSLTFDVGSILAGLGIGGVAVALAAKDTISNLFGSVTVILDRPFHVGDLIVLEKGVEGTVEQVGFRSTRLRTPHHSLITMPNSLLANIAIDNYGMRKLRRFKTIIQLDINNPIDKVEEFINQIKYAVQIHSLIEKENVNNIVALNDIVESNLNIQLIIYFNTQSGVVEIEERHKFILEILKIAKSLEIVFSSPLTLKNKEN